MVLFTRISKNLLNKRICNCKFSLSNLSGIQAETQENKTYFGFEEVNQTEKQHKGNKQEWQF